MQAPQATLERPVFSVDGRTYRWDAVVRAASARGELDDLQRQTAEGIAAVERLDSEGRPLGETEVETAAEAWRRERSLLAAEDMEAWLARWELDAADWREHVGRRLARDRLADDLSKSLARDGPHANRVEDALWAEAVCSGALARWAHALAGRAAAAEALGRPHEDEATLDTVLAELSDRAHTPEAAAKLLQARQVDWLRIDYDALLVPEEGMAREAALCVLEDGMSLAEVAGRAGVAVEERSVLLEEVPPLLSEQLMSAAPGDFVGPVALDDAFVVASVRAKRPAAMEDPVIQARLSEELPRRAIQAEVTNRVRWHERL